MSRTIRHVLATVPFKGAARARLERVFAPAPVTFAARRARADIDRALAECDVAVTHGVPDQRYFEAPSMRWIHCDQSGLDRIARPEVVASDIIITSSAGRSAPVLAEHALFFMLALVYRFPAFHEAQRRRVWGVHGQDELRGLFGRHLLVVGLGHTGRALVERARVLGMRVTAYTRTPRHGPWPDVEVRARDAGDNLDDLLPDADIVALCASLNDGSFRMIGARQLALMKAGAFIVNVARAELVDEAAMAACLRDGRLGGVGTDVAYEEPLPPWRPFWRLPNLLITPHVTPQMPDRAMCSLDILEENVARYRRGEALANRLGPEDVFTKGRPQQPSRRAQALTRRWRRWAMPRLG